MSNQKSVTGKKQRPASQTIMEVYPACKEKCTLIAIASFADPDGKNCHPSIAKIAERSGKSIRATQMHIRTMINRNDIKVLYQKQKYHKASVNIFWFTHTKVKEALTGISRYQIRLPMPEERGAVVLSDETKKMISDMFARYDEERTGLTSTGAIVPKIATTVQVQRTQASILQDVEMFESLGTDCTELRVKYGLPARGVANSFSSDRTIDNDEKESALLATCTTGDAAD